MCIRDSKRVIKVHGDEEVGEALTTYTLSQTHEILAAKVEEITLQLSRAVDVEEIRKLAETLSILLKTLEQCVKLKERLTG